MQLTTLVHGEEAARGAEQASAVLFGGDVHDVDEAGFEVLAREVPTLDLAAGELAEGLDVVDLLVRAGLATSKGEARRFVDQGGVYVNGEPVPDVDRRVAGGDALEGRYVLLRRGKSTWQLLREPG